MSAVLILNIHCQILPMNPKFHLRIPVVQLSVYFHVCLSHGIIEHPLALFHIIYKLQDSSHFRSILLKVSLQIIG